MLKNLPHRLYLRIYVALLASLVAASCLFALVHYVYDRDQVRNSFDTFADVAGEVLPPPTASTQEQQRALRHWRRKVRADMALYAADGTPIAQAGPPLPRLRAGQASNSRLQGSANAFALRLPDGRWLVFRHMHARRFPFQLLMLATAAAAIIAIGAFPVVRRLTRRLERLQNSVERWGSGDLSSRVAVEGRDEVAMLATSFNHSAERIEALMAAQKSLLANASHELRSPLARIRMAVELMEAQASPAMRAELDRNIAELDQLIDEVLLASRLDSAQPAAEAHGPVDLAAMLAEECTRTGAAFDAEALTVTGDARLLRRLVRNLLENARRYGADKPVNADLRRVGERVVLEVCDQGPGVPEAERERIFEPFYRVPGASEAAGGVGLGLSLVRQIAQHHQGSVLCVPGPKGGCCFRVMLPG